MNLRSRLSTLIAVRVVVSTLLLGIQWVLANKDTYGVRVMNLSIGGFSSSKTCSAVEQNAINSALSRNAVVVVSAGNEHFDAAFASPANCAGVDDGGV